ncbi:MAG: hypothetical protein NVS2B17_18370 [Candidatus Velthaea sp.]
MTTISAGQLTPRDIAPDFATQSIARAEHAVSIAVGDDVLRVYFEQAIWAEGFAERYADQVAAASAPVVSHYVVRAAEGYAFWSPGIAAWYWERGELPVDAIVFLADATAITSLLNASQALVSFHAAAVGLDGIAAAIAGDSNAGKTTTALACGRAGLQLYSDERCVVKGRVVVPFARTLSVRTDGWNRLQSDPGTGAAGLPSGARPTADGFRIRISDLFGRFDRVSAPELRAVFLLCGRADRARLVPATWYDVAPALAKWMNGADRGLQRGARLIETLRDVSCYRLYLGSPDESANLIRATLTQIARQRAS